MELQEEVEGIYIKFKFNFFFWIHFFYHFSHFIYILERYLWRIVGSSKNF
jgi:hypothetical protein